MLDEDESDLNEYLDDPTDPVMCVPEQDHDDYWSILRGARECKFGGPGSTVNFWELSTHSERLTLGVKMHSTAAFLHACAWGRNHLRWKDNQRIQ